MVSGVPTQAASFSTCVSNVSFEKPARMVEDGEHGSGNEAGFIAAHRGRSQEYDRVWAVAAIRVEIVFDRTDVRVAEFVAYRDQI